MSDFADLIHALDKQQSDPSLARYCKVSADHGKMAVHGSGAMLICGAKKCEYMEPTVDPRGN